MSKITFICAVYPPEPAPSGVMAEQLAARLAGDGHDVRMVVPFPSRPEGVLHPGFRRKLRSPAADPSGFTVVRCANWLIGSKRRALDRLLEGITFGITATWAAWREGRPDVMIIESWPIVGVLPLCWLARLWGVPYLNYVKDVYPETAEEAGILAKNGMAARLLRRMDHWICQNSAENIVISDTMRDLLADRRNMPRERFTVVPDWVSEEHFPRQAKNDEWRMAQGIGNQFVAMYSGTIGHVSGAEVLVDVAGLLHEEKDVLLLCVGEGVKKQAMREEADRRSLTNLLFLPFQPIGDVPAMQSSADAALLTMEARHANASVPSKLISYLAASRPVIVAADAGSAVARTVAQYEAGLVALPGDARAIANAILELRRDRNRSEQMGANARRCFEENYTLRRAQVQFAALLSGIHVGGSTQNRARPMGASIH